MVQERDEGGALCSSGILVCYNFLIRNTTECPSARACAPKELQPECLPRSRHFD
jgi:hypothetical protein